MQTTDKVNVSHFEVEKSRDGKALSPNEISVEVDRTISAGRYILNIQDQGIIKSVPIVKE